MSQAFLNLNDIHTLQVDHNSTCNLACPQCARTVSGEVNRSLPQKFLPLSFYERVFTRELCSSIERVFFCGNYGDVIASPNILQVCRYLKSQGLKTISIVTNGSLRDRAWWTDLATILSGKTDKVLFSIDGFADTNHLYRVGSNFDKIMENAAAFIAAGGTARWEYLVFAHNEHQVDEAKKRAKEMGFDSFKLKKTNRFIVDKNYKSGKKDTTFEVHGKAQNFLTSLKAPREESLQTKSLSRFDEIIKKHKTWENYIENSQITCKAQLEKTMFIDFQGDLWPCTWMAAPPYFHGDENSQKIQLLKVIDHYGSGFNSLLHNEITEVIAHPWFASELVKSWSGSLQDPVPKMMTCGRTCGQDYEFSSNAPENKELIRFER